MKTPKERAEIYLKAANVLHEGRATYIRAAIEKISGPVPDYLWNRVVPEFDFAYDPSNQPIENEHRVVFLCFCSVLCHDKDFQKQLKEAGNGVD